MLENGAFAAVRSAMLEALHGRRRTGGGIALAAAASVLPCPAFAQPAEDATIIVTGERADRTVMDTASSLSVVTAAELARQPDTDRLDQLLARTVNVTLGSGGQGPTIRGLDSTGVLRDLPAFLGGTRPRTTLIVDGRAVSYNEFVFGTQPLWDVERVEIFRSPQTTTQGRNSIAGAIFVETAAPQMRWHAAGRMLAGNYDTRQISAMVTGPLIADQLAIRIAGDLRRSRTASELTSPVTAADPNGDDFDLLRIRLRGAPSALPGLKIDAGYYASRSQAPQIEGIRPPFRDRRDPAAYYGIFEVSNEALTLRSRWDVAPATSLSAMLSLGSASAQRFAPPGFGEAMNHIRDRSAELVLTHRGDHFALVAGASASLVRLRQDIDLSVVGLGIGGFRDRQESAGIFGEAEWEALPRLTVTLGGRYQHDRQQRAGGLLARAGALALDYDGRFDALLPKLALAYKATEQTVLGISVQRASNPSGATLSVPTGRLDSFAAEHLWAWEIFVRGTLGDGRPGAPALTYRANLFAYDMHDAQRSALRAVETPGGTFFVQETGNVPRARSRGGELEVTWNPAAALSVTLAGGILGTRIIRTPTGRDPLAGREFQRSPRFTAAAGLSWRVVPDALLDLSYSHRSGYFSDDQNTPGLRVGAADVIDARASWQAGPLRLFAFARNLLGDFHLTALFDDGTLATAGDPAEYGIGAEARF